MSFALSSQNIHLKGNHLHAHTRRIDGTWNEEAKIKHCYTDWWFSPTEEDLAFYLWKSSLLA